jgi:hypothetical protein
LLPEDLPPPPGEGGIIFVEVERLVLLGKGFAFVGCHGVGGTEAVGVSDAVFFGDEIVSGAHAGRPGLGVVRVGGEEVDPAVREHTVGHAFGLTTHLANDGAGGDLGEEANAHPVGEALGVALQGWIALGVGKDGAHAGQAQLVKRFVEVGREAVVGEFDEEIVATVERIFFGIGDGVLHVVVAEVEVAAGGDGKGNGFGGEGGAEGVDAASDFSGVEVIDVVGVRGSDDVGYAVFRGDTGHGQGGLEVGRAVVETGEEMMVEIDHASYRQSTTVQEFVRPQIPGGSGSAERASVHRRNRLDRTRTRLPVTQLHV